MPTEVLKIFRCEFVNFRFIFRFAVIVAESVNSAGDNEFILRCRAGVIQFMAHISGNKCVGVTVNKKNGILCVFHFPHWVGVFFQVITGKKPAPDITERNKKRAVKLLSVFNGIYHFLISVCKAAVFNNEFDLLGRIALINKHYGCRPH